MAVKVPGRPVLAQATSTPPYAQPKTPGGSGTTSTTRPSTSGGSSFDAGIDAAAAGDSEIADKLDAFRNAILSGEDVSMAGAGDLSVLTSDGRAHPGLGGTRKTSSRRSVAQLLNEMSQWDSEEVARMQQRLYDAGYFPKAFYDNPDTNQVAWGDRFDQNTRRAFGMLLADGVAYGDLSIDDILTDRASDLEHTGRLANGQKAKRAGIVAGGNLYVTQTSDPATTRAMADDIATAILGRKPTDADKARYAGLITGAERAGQAKVQGAQEANDRRTFGARVASATADAASDEEGGGGGFESFVSNIISQESGGNIKAIGQPTKYGTATGKYQVLDSTWKGYRGYGRAADAPQAVQDEFARNKLRGYYNQFGAEGAAVAWYAGPARAAEYVANPDDPKWRKPQTANGKQFPSIAEYAQRAAAGTGGGVTSAGGGASSADVYLAPTFVEQSAVDTRAQLNEQIRADNPDEAAAHDIALQYDRFRSIVGADRAVQ